MKALLFCVALLAGSIVILVMGIIHRKASAILLGASGTTLFGFFILLLANPNQLACMQMVKGEMTYKQLKVAVEAEDFEQPIRFTQKKLRPGLFLVSRNWIVVEDHSNLVYVPKSKVRQIELRMEPVEFGPELSGDENTYTHLYHYFVFICDEKHAFATGLFPRDIATGAWRVIQRHFPNIPIQEVDTPMEWKQ